MKLPRDLSGRELVAHLRRASGYQRLHQEGSHIVLQTDAPRRHRIAVPDHRALRVGTLNAILGAVAEVQGVSKEDAVRRILG
jgi:predicted RNA binding protein YcfA (HicA-like mRNA interferase family)